MKFCQHSRVKTHWCLEMLFFLCLRRVSGRLVLQVIAMSHHPVGGGLSYYKQWETQLVVDYGDVILLHAQGHNHNDHFNVVSLVAFCLRKKTCDFVVRATCQSVRICQKLEINEDTLSAEGTNLIFLFLGSSSTQFRVKPEVTNCRLRPWARLPTRTRAAGSSTWTPTPWSCSTTNTTSCTLATKRVNCSQAPFNWPFEPAKSRTKPDMTGIFSHRHSEVDLVPQISRLLFTGLVEDPEIAVMYSAAEDYGMANMTAAGWLDFILRLVAAMNMAETSTKQR